MEHEVKIQKRVPVLLNLFSYLKRPQLEVKNTDDWVSRFFNVLRLWSLCFFLSLIFALISNFFLERIDYEQEEFALNRVFEETSAFAVFMAVVFIAPITEEIAFRLGLKFSPLKWGVSITMLLTFLIMLLEIPIVPEFFMNFSSWFNLLFTFLVFVISSLAIMLLIRLKEAKIYAFFKNNFRYFFYSLGILFAFLHITNYQEDWINLIHLSPLLVMPQFLLSFAISFIRMQYNFFWAIFAHALNNFVVICIVLLLWPAVAASSLPGVDEQTMLKSLSVIDVFSVSLGTIFFIGILFLVALCIFSLLFEIYYSKKHS